MAGTTVTENIGAAGDFIDACAYAIELITFSLFFFEEGFQNFLRGYYSALLYKKQGDIMVFSYNDFDYMMRWWIDFYNQFGFIAVYSADGYMANIYMNLMYREYGNILMGKGYLYYEMSKYGVPWWHGVKSYTDPQPQTVANTLEDMMKETEDFLFGKKQ